MFYIIDFIPFPRGLVLLQYMRKTFPLIFWPHVKPGWFFTEWLFVSGVVQVLIVRTNSCTLQGYRLSYIRRNTSYIYIR